jgi:ribosomal protein S13
MIMDERLLYTIKNSKRLVQKKYLTLPAWAYLMDLMGIGSTKAYEVCKELGIDPEKKAKDI